MVLDAIRNQVFWVLPNGMPHLGALDAEQAELRDEVRQPRPTI
jgi:hypothetical protein